MDGKGRTTRMMFQFASVSISFVMLAGMFCLAAAEQGQDRQIFSQVWRKKIAQTQYPFYRREERASPSADPAMNRIFVGTADGKFYSIEKSNAEMAWEFNAGDPVSSSALVTASAVYFGTEGGALFALRKSDGSLKWKYQTEAPVIGKPAESEGILFFTSTADAIHALDAETGKYIWHFKKEIPFSIQVERGASAAVSHGGVVGGFASGYVAMFNAISGDIVWERRLAAQAEKYTEVSDVALKGQSVLAVVFGTSLFSLGHKDGAIQWKVGIESANLIAAVPEGILVSGSDGTLSLYSEGNPASLRWSRKVASSGSLSRPLGFGNLALVGSSTGGSFVVERSKGTLLQVLQVENGICGAFAAIGDSVFFLSNGGFLYRLDFHGESIISRSIEDIIGVP